MRGIWIIRLARPFLHEDTFELMLAPAIADLQSAPCAAAYRAAWMTSICAVCLDFVGDLHTMSADVATLAALFLIQGAYYACMLTLLASGIQARDAVAILLDGGSPQLFAALTVVILLSAVPTLFCFWPERRPSRAADETHGHLIR